MSQRSTLFASVLASDKTTNKGIRGLGNNGNGNGKGNKTCTTYKINGPLILKNSAVFRSARIDQITSETQCVNISTFAGGALGASFCSGDTFSIGATPFFDQDGNEMGYYTRSGMRVPLFDVQEGENPILVGNAFNAFVFKNGDQLHFQRCDPAGAPTLVTAIAGGTGEYVGSIGEVTITDFLKPSDNLFEVCIVKREWEY
ncbi:predicted protein [Chaetoceros tenuissimus]|uniref:Uncharacterized protein n=1 Tax=Chaetoceros tenuissimus TaxID=426638 RepID=A0AAD3CSZ8_9STRA|nr:predicted protein [Chaetoceros tenuissimus]